MDNKSFNFIDLETKAQYVFGYGEYISTIEYYGNKVDLYIVGGFYVEAFFNGKTDDLEQIQILEPDERRLRLYSKNVDIGNLFKK